MQDDPIAREKLLLARAEMLEIIKRYDIAAHVVMHAAPNAAEVIIELSPSYSVVTHVDGGFHIRSKLEDYNGDAEAQRRDLAASANMASSLFELSATAAIHLGELSKTINKKTGAKHSPVKHIKHN